MPSPENKAISFKAYSHTNFEKTTAWFVIVFSVLLALAGLFIFLKQYTGAGVVVAFGILIYIYSKVEPKEIACTISAEGVKIDQAFYRFGNLKSFWMTRVAQDQMLYLEKNSRFNAVVSVSLGDQPAVSIKETLSKYLPEKSGGSESLADKIMRIFRF